MTSIFTADSSTQLSGGSTNVKTYNTKDNPNIRLFSKSGIYNSADNEIKFFTNNTDALTINSSQKVICDGSMITNLTYNNITGKPTNFQSDWLTTVINKPSLFDGTWTSLSGKPTNFQSDWNSTIINKPNLFSGNYNDLTNKVFINSGTDIYNNNTGNVGIGISNPTAKLHVKGDLRCELVFSTLITSIGNLFASKPPWGIYFADDWDSYTNTLYDSSGYNRNATTTGTITKTTASGNGATAPITYISGNSTATVSFPTGSIPTAFTILGLTRYNGGTRARILQSRSSVNWLLGHVSGTRGMAYFVNSYYTDGAGITGSADDWLTSIAKSSGTIPSNILMNGIQKGAGSANTTGGYDLGINLGTTGQYGDWALSTVMIWDSVLTDSEMVLLNTTINNYKSTGNPIVYELSKMFFTSEIYSTNNFYFNREIFKNNINISNIFVTSNVHSNTSNFLYNQIGNVNLTNYFTKDQTSNIFITSNVIQNSTNLVNYNNITNKPTNFQSDWNSTVINRPNELLNISNIFVSSNVIQNSTNLINYNNLTNTPNLTLKQDVISVSNPIIKTGNALSLSYDSTLTLNGTQLSVASANKWTTSGTNIYNNNTGNVGIGNVAPIYNLQVGNNTTTGILGVTTIHLANSYLDNGSYGIRLYGYDNGVNGHNLAIQTRNTGTGSFNNSLIVNTSGYVGINTNNPVSRFTIRGDYSVIDNNFCLDATDNAGVNNKYNFKIYPYVIGAGQVGYKIRVISNTTNITDALTFSDVGNVAIGNITPSYKLQIEDGSVFLGDSAYSSTSLGTANGYKLIFDNTYNSAVGSGNICNKILLHNTSSFNAGFGIESGALVYQSGDSHSFYTGTTPSAYGTRRMLLSSGGNLNINADNNAYTRLNVNGVVSINGGTNYSAYNNQLLAGALSIGNLNTNYGGASGWSTNTAGLLMECLNNTEIVILDSGDYLISALYYVGGSSKYIEYGRAMGYGHPNGHYFKCNQTFECYFANAVGSWNYFKVEPTSLWGDGLSTASDQAGTKYLTMRNLMFQNPHVVPASVGGNAYIRYGRAGGVSSGTWWETGTRTDGRFHIAREATYFSSSMIIKPNGNSAFGNENPYDDPSAPNSYQFLHLGNSAIANVCDWNLCIHKSNGSGGNRNFAMGYDSSWYETIGDNGNNNQGSGNWLSHLSMAYYAPDYSLQLLGTGNFQVYGTISSGSDIKIKKGIKTIDNALWKVQQLRGVEYTHVIEGTRNIGLIAQEVEGIIPEVVNYNERTDMKSVNYANLTALLINAIKEQQEQIKDQAKRISKIEELLYNLINK